MAVRRKNLPSLIVYISFRGNLRIWACFTDSSVSNISRKDLSVLVSFMAFTTSIRFLHLSFKISTSLAYSTSSNLSDVRLSYVPFLSASVSSLLVVVVYWYLLRLIDCWFGAGLLLLRLFGLGCLWFLGLILIFLCLWRLLV